MKHFDLFSGIGCWALASGQVWPDREMVGFCEIDPFCKAVLKKHFPNLPIYEDVKTLTFTQLASDALLRHEQEQQGGGSLERGGSSEPRNSLGAGTGDRTKSRNSPQGVRQLGTGSPILYGTQRTNSNSDRRGLEGERPQQSSGGSGQVNRPRYEIDLLTGSPPCQAASTAGKRKGTSDNRWLWPDTIRLLGEIRPRWFIFENVAGLLSLGGGLEFDKVCAGLENQGYEIWPTIIPACGVGAPHKRDRVWIVGKRKASADPEHHGGARTETSSEYCRPQPENATRAELSRYESEGGDSLRNEEAGRDEIPEHSLGEDTQRNGRRGRRKGGGKVSERRATEIQTPRPDSQSDSHANDPRLEGHGELGQCSRQQPVGSEGGETTADAAGRRGRPLRTGDSREESEMSVGNGSSSVAFSQRSDGRRKDSRLLSHEGRWSDEVGATGLQSENRSTCPDDHQQGNRFWKSDGFPDWSADWREVAASTCHDRVDDGPAVGLDGVTYTSSKHRINRLKACGNAIVLQVAVELMKAIKKVDENL